ncbi:MAG: CdaR family protein [Chloroflexota bacterium]
MFRWIIKNIRTLFTAFILAIAIWVSAVSASDPDRTQDFPRQVRIEIVGQDPGLVISGSIPQNVQLTLRAPQTVWDQLISEEGAIRAVADLSGLAPGTHTVEVQIQIAITPVRVIARSPQTITLVLESLITRSIPIELTVEGEPAVGFQAETPILETSEVLISGPQSIVESIAAVHASIQITGTRQDVEAVLPLYPETVDGETVQGITMYPEQVQVRVPVTQLIGYRDLAVKVVTRGRVASGYRLTSVSVFPPLVTVFSDNAAIIDSLPGQIETMPLDLSGTNDDIEVFLELNIPEGIMLIGEQHVLVQIGIAPIEGSLTMSYRPVEIINLSPSLQATISPVRVDVILSGPLPVLETLSPSDVLVVINAERLTVGTYQLAPTVEILVQGVTVESILPGTVEVVIRPAFTPTP